MVANDDADGIARLWLFLPLDHLCKTILDGCRKIDSNCFHLCNFGLAEIVLKEHFEDGHLLLVRESLFDPFSLLLVQFLGQPNQVVEGLLDRRLVLFRVVFFDDTLVAFVEVDT